MSHTIPSTPRARSRRSSRGLTLIELLVVMGIVAMMIQMATMGLGGVFQAELHKSTNELANVMRFAYDRSRVTGMNYRLHINFETRTMALQQADERMFLPATDRDGKVAEIDEDKIKDQAERDERAAENFNRSVQSDVFSGGEGGEFDPFDPYKVGAKQVPRRKPPLFQSFDSENTLSSLGKAIVFPEEIKIVSVRTDADFQPITEGEASVYFFPSGRTQKAHIQLADEDEEEVYTIILEPLTGKVTVEPELLDLVLPRDPKGGEDDLGKTVQRRSF